MGLRVGKECAQRDERALCRFPLDKLRPEALPADLVNLRTHVCTYLCTYKQFASVIRFMGLHACTWACTYGAALLVPPLPPPPLPSPPMVSPRAVPCGWASVGCAAFHDCGRLGVRLLGVWALGYDTVPLNSDLPRNP